MVSILKTDRLFTYLSIFQILIKMSILKTCSQHWPCFPICRTVVYSHLPGEKKHVTKMTILWKLSYKTNATQGRTLKKKEKKLTTPATTGPLARPARKRNCWKESWNWVLLNSPHQCELKAMFFSPCLSGLTDRSSGARTQQEWLRSGALAMPGLSLWRMADENPLRMEEKGVARSNNSQQSTIIG